MYDEWTDCPKCGYYSQTEMIQDHMDSDAIEEIWRCKTCGTTWRIDGEVDIQWTRRVVLKERDGQKQAGQLDLF